MGREWSRPASILSSVGGCLLKTTPVLYSYFSRTFMKEKIREIWIWVKSQVTSFYYGEISNMVKMTFKKVTVDYAGFVFLRVNI